MLISTNLCSQIMCILISLRLDCVYFLKWSLQPMRWDILTDWSHPNPDWKWGGIVSQRKLWVLLQERRRLDVRQPKAHVYTVIIHMVIFFRNKRKNIFILIIVNNLIWKKGFLTFFKWFNVHMYNPNIKVSSPVWFSWVSHQLLDSLKPHLHRHRKSNVIGCPCILQRIQVFRNHIRSD